MVEFIPAEYYAPIYYNFLLLITLVVYLTTSSTDIDDESNLSTKNAIGIFILIAITIFVGLRPVSGKYFGDMRVYAGTFEKYQLGEPLFTAKDVYFQYFLKWSSGVMNLETFFLLCMGLYIIPLYLFSKEIFGKYWFYSFYVIVISLSFYGYGVNGIRNGIATSMILLAISKKNLRQQIIFFLLAFAAHKSALIIIAAYFAAQRFKTPKFALAFWVITIPLSLLMRGFWESFFLDFAFGEDDRLSGYLGADSGGDIADRFSRTGFRWDFVLYSLTGVFAGWYFIYHKKYEDKFYNTIYVLFLLTNGFWVLINQATYSNRFAYLSWFIIGPVIIYPLLKVKFFNNQNKVVAVIIAAYFFITYMLDYFLPNQ